MSKDLATAYSVIAEARAADFHIAWSGDGHAAALLHQGAPIAWVSAADEHGYGYSKAVSRISAFARPWDEAAYRQVFAQ